MLEWTRRRFKGTWRGQVEPPSPDARELNIPALYAVIQPTYRASYVYIVENVFIDDGQPTCALVEYDNGEHVMYWTENHRDPYDLEAWLMVPLTHGEIASLNERGTAIVRSIALRGRQGAAWKPTSALM